MKRKRKRKMRATCDECNQDSRGFPASQSVPVVILCLGLLSVLLLATEAAQLDYQISAQVGEAAKLPCTIGNPAFCGLPYLIAWYKLNTNSWQRVSPRAKHSSHQSSCELPAQPHAAISSRQHQFKCTFIALNPVELADEGQYKCEVTYSEALDSDRCPPATVSEFNVVAVPSEPEIILNGKPITEPNQVVSLKEGSQVRLECQSWGGKPAPRIEWLNVSESRFGEPEVTLLQSRWTQKKSSSNNINNNHNQVTASGVGLQPLSTASVSVALSRHDLNVRFACLVQVAGVGRLEQPLEQLVGPIPPPGAMLRWIKLDVQVRPSGVQLSVFQLDHTRQLVQQLKPQEDQVYSLQPASLYAVQCQVAHSRPRSQVSWFNRSAPIQLEPVELEAELGELASLAEHQQEINGKLSSFVRTISHPDGTFSTLATLLLRTSVWDAPEELICRPSNEAFELEDLIQVAPIVTARLSVNYPPVAFLEAAADEPLANSLNGTGLLRLTEGRPLVLKCTVAANPIGHNTILQIEWTYQRQKLGSPASRSATLGQQAVLASRSTSPVIERPNHLHMPQGPSSRLLHTSHLSILSARISDSGSYGCHFKLTPAPSGQSGAPGASSSLSQQPGPPRITSGQANRTIQVHVIEATSGGPTLRVRTHSPEAGLLVYGRRGARLLTAVLSPIKGHSNLSVSLWCDTGAITSTSNDPQTAQRIVWYHNGAQLHSDAHTDTYNLSLGPEVGQANSKRLGTYSCAQQYVQGPTSAFQASQLRFQASRNQVELRMRAGPRLLVERRELMPTSRGFSQLELLGRPEGRLRLACSAHCEPLCSIDWIIDGRPIERPPTSKAATEGTRVRVPVAAALEDGLEPLFWSEALASRQNESMGPAWRRTSSLLVAPSESTNLGPGDGPQPGNVHSRLELSYRQIGLLFGLTSLDGRLLSRSHQLPIKCQINRTEPFLAGPFGSATVKPGNWFPTKTLDTARDDDNELTSDLMVEQGPPTNLTSKSTPMSSDDYWAPQYGGPSWHWWDTQWAAEEVDQPARSTSGTSDEMQISLLLDGPPSQVSLAFSGSISTGGSGASVTEGQLLELLSPGQRAPTLTCTALSQPRARFRWTFVNLNKTEHQLAYDSPQLSLRQLVEWSRHKMGADYGNQVASIGLALVSSLVGNYTCTVWNEFGSSSDSLVLGFQGRPICNLSVEGDSKLRCSVYSDPQLLETVWFKDNQQVALNRSGIASASPLLDSQTGLSPLWSIDLPLSQHSDETKSSNFRCIARNPLGYSATCELGFPLERSIAQQTDTAPRQTPPMSMITIPDVKHIDGLPIRLPDQPNVSSVFQQLTEPALGSQSQSLANSGGDKVRALLRVFLGKIDWLLLAGCLLTVSWLLFLLGGSFFRGRFGGHLQAAKQPRHNSHTSWSFSTNRSSRCTRATGCSSAGSAAELPVGGLADTRSFLKPCPTNYYGSSNADSDRDMVQSCSQSSHYEVDYGVAATTCANQTHQFPNPRPIVQPLYFNGPSSTTLLRRNNTMKQSMSSSTMIMGPELLAARADATQSRHPQALATSTNKHQITLGLSSNVPLINGTHNSRIDIDQQQQQAKYSSNQLQNQFGLHARDQQLRGEHIYDRVIYGQMIL